MGLLLTQEEIEAPWNGTSSKYRFVLAAGLAKKKKFGPKMF